MNLKDKCAHGKPMEEDCVVCAKLYAIEDRRNERIARLEAALERAVQLAGIASDWDLGDNGRVEIDGKWISCYELKAEFKAALSKAKGE